MTNASTPNPYESLEFSLERWRERFVLIVLRAASILGIVVIATVLNRSTPVALLVIYGVLYLLLLVVTLARSPYIFRAGMLVIAAYLIGISDMLASGIAGSSRIYLIAFVLLANLLFSYRASLFAFGISLVSMGVIGTLMASGLFLPTSPSAEAGSWADWIGSTASYLLIVAIINSAINMLKTEFQRAYDRGGTMLTELQSNQLTLEARVADRTASLEKNTAQLSAANLVAKRIASIKEISDLLPNIVDIVTEKFKIHHAGIYLLNDRGEFGYLQAASSEGGKRMLAKGHQVNMNGQGPIEKCVAQNYHQVMHDISPETAERMNPDLPTTRSRATFPLTMSGKVIGVLDLHSEAPNSFQPSELEAYQIVADQLSLAIENVRLLSDLQAVIGQMQRATEFRSQISWMESTKNRPQAYQYTPLNVQKIGFAPELKQDAGALLVPIVLRGQKIGVLQFKRKGATTSWLEQEQILVQEVAAQIALALENARLLEDAQARAARERLLGEISARIGSVADVDAVLRATAQEIGKVLGDSEVTVQLRPEGMDA